MASAVRHGTPSWLARLVHISGFKLCEIRICSARKVAPGKHHMTEEKEEGRKPFGAASDRQPRSNGSQTRASTQREGETYRSYSLASLVFFSSSH